MTENIAEMSHKLIGVVQLISNDEIVDEFGNEATAGLLVNPTVTWAKFVLTDDKRNANGQRIPKDEFPNLMRSGVYMPLKMAVGEINRGHENSKPLGVITHLKELATQDGSSALVALAALWTQERPSDVTYIKDRFASNQPVNVSWEILYTTDSFNQEQDSIDLHGTTLKAATIVGDPAYQGRTPFLSVSAKKWSEPYIRDLPDSSFLYVGRDNERLFPVVDAKGKVDQSKVAEALENLGASKLPMGRIREIKQVLTRLQSQFEAGASVEEVSAEFLGTQNIMEEVTLNKSIEDLQADVLELTTKLNEAKTALTEKETALAAKADELTEMTEKVAEQETELATLREFKASIDAEVERQNKLDEVKSKFVEAGIEKGEEYFTDNAETLIALSSESLDFMIQELKAFAEGTKSESASKHDKKTIPALSGTNEGEPSVSDVAKALRELHAKK